ncbi:flavin reductase family protein [Streptomyces sp. QL37]|uniref:flavin reductase family protein n=1 Tax=Streptomyces sp. QL37 TaxID=2093747 RepID=UPI000CF2F4C8|nr:flavin reductase family protein [Streptomyces sp. QL37]PPQ61990.1 flavin reductase [Streptomyces sp. QL37]
MTSLDQRTFTQALAKVPSPVTVITTSAPSEPARRWGFTASSFTSLSLDPPLVLVCLAKSAGSHQVFTSTEKFMVNVLAADQAHIASRFASRQADKFSGGDMEPCEADLPGLAAAAVRLSCSSYDVADGGDHSILIGRVEEVHIGDQGSLVYYDRAFVPLSRERQLVSR